MQKKLALQCLKVMIDNLNSLMTMSIAYQKCTRCLDEGSLKHNARIMVGLAVASHVKLIEDEKEILKHLTKGGK